MTTVTLSPKFQIVIPKEISEEMELKPGQKLQIIALDERIEFIIVKKIEDARGFIKGINTDVEREEGRL